MKIVKRLHLFVLKSFLPLFMMTFFIVLFIVLMQFLWKYIDDLVGKGLSMQVIGELFFYAAVSMVPMALPLAILLASLMTFGNLGERFELTAMKAAGISLVRVMAPLIVLISGVAVGAFYFQNNVLPIAQVKMWTLLFSMRQKNPEVEIPEGIFYDQIPGINLYVSKKNRNTGMLYDVKIYDVRHGGENVTILVSDSAYMAMTQDMEYIYLYMYKGNQYERMTGNSNMRNDPFRRESFHTKEIFIPFDNNFNRLDEQGMREQYVGKNIEQLQNTIDSIEHRLDSIGIQNTPAVARSIVPAIPDAGQTDKRNKSEDQPGKPLSFDSLMQSLSPSAYNNVVSAAIHDVDQRRNALMFESETVAQEKKIVRRHGIELIKKFTLSIACIIFFFIGAPLGAIIRKGGIGMPMVISVILFMIYYIFDNAGYKMARDGHAPVPFGIWLSTMIMAPLGIFVTYKAMNDSSVFDPDRIKLVFRKMLFRKDKRALTLKEVIINDILAGEAYRKIIGINGLCKEILKEIKGRYLFIGKSVCIQAREVEDRMEELVEYLHDSRDNKIITLLNRYPVFHPGRFTSVRSLRRTLKAILRINEAVLQTGAYETPSCPEIGKLASRRIEFRPGDLKITGLYDFI